MKTKTKVNGWMKEKKSEKRKKIFEALLCVFVFVWGVVGEPFLRLIFVSMDFICISPFLLLALLPIKMAEKRESECVRERTERWAEKKKKKKKRERKKERKRERESERGGER